MDLLKVNGQTRDAAARIYNGQTRDAAARIYKKLNERANKKIYLFSFSDRILEVQNQGLDPRKNLRHKTTRQHIQKTTSQARLNILQTQHVHPSAMKEERHNEIIANFTRNNRWTVRPSLIKQRNHETR
jgi:hypothetical protein